MTRAEVVALARYGAEVRLKAIKAERAALNRLLRGRPQLKQRRALKRDAREVAPAPPVTRRRRISKEARERMAAAARARWAKQKRAEQ